MPHSEEFCEKCDKEILFDTTQRTYRVLCNVYVNDKWDRLECYHPECYEQTGFIHGPILDRKVKSERVKKVKR